MKTDDVSFAAVPYQLNPGDQMYEKGRHFRLDQFDGGQFYFRDRPELDQFVSIHGYKLVKEEEMARLRTEFGSDEQEEAI